uniref:Uncharacterized protein n=1 Tax=Myoviridae sp. ctqfO1 TaxID=2827710 RepID=A0A8S5T2E2_9CAUD|nr:MAG TPA: hypothetical protein [Myoviridae sp. ctqfO1]
MLIYIMQSSKAIEPIKQFKSIRELKDCAKWWQKRLFLENWFIKYELVDKRLAKESGEPIDGYCQFSVENKEAKIVISNMPTEEGIVEFSAELTLVHELLHIKREYLPRSYSEEDVESFEDILLHQSQEEMAKTLLLTKYGIEKDWFLR